MFQEILIEIANDSEGCRKMVVLALDSGVRYDQLVT